MKLSSQIKGAITKLVKAEEADAFKGMGDPADHEVIEARLKKAREHVARLMVLVDNLEQFHEDTLDDQIR